jgi:hypothetical protein
VASGSTSGQVKVTTDRPAMREAIERLRTTGDDRPMIALYVEAARYGYDRPTPPPQPRRKYGKGQPPKAVPSLSARFVDAAGHYLASGNAQPLYDLAASLDAPTPLPVANGAVRKRHGKQRPPRVVEAADVAALRADNQAVMNERLALVRTIVEATPWEALTIDYLYELAATIERPAERREAIRALVKGATKYADVAPARRRFLRVVEREWATRGKPWATEYAVKVMKQRATAQRNEEA